MKRIFSHVLVFILGLSFLHAQNIYPGDVDNSGRVDGIDVLYFGMAYGQNGSARATGTTAWEQQTIDMIWATSFLTGLNHAYADCNGDGTVSDFDLFVVESNFDSTWHSNQSSLPSGDQGVDPELTLNILNSNPNIVEGDTINLSVSLGDASIPVDSFYGITFTIKYNSDLFKDEALDFQLAANPWIDTDPNGANIKIFRKDKFSEGEAVVAITRTNGFSINGSGILGTCRIVTEDIVVGLSQDTSTTVTIEDVTVLSPSSTNITFTPIYTEDLPITIANDTALVITAVESLEQYPILKVFPNPAKDLIIAESSDAIIDQHITLYDLYGRSYNVRQEVKSLEKIHLYPEDTLPTGMYIISVRTEKGIISEKILVE